ncbi:MAG TPA: penicillin-binding protein 1C [Acidobacteriota bacterium]|nr:penicillin-binding protein 1C [Acidobacteriota bacterium]
MTKRRLLHRLAWVLGGLACLAGLLWWGTLPEVESFQAVKENFSRSDAVFLSRQKEVLQEVRVDMQGRRLRWTPLADISPALREAVLLAEDRRFFSHAGVDWRAAAGAATDWLRGQGLRGASTISMQAAALIDPRLRAQGRRSWMQKWNQVLTARALESSWSKEEILEAYLNLVWFRGELQGVEAASRGLFGKRPHGLERAEAALAAALIRAPNASWEQVAQRAQLLWEGASPAQRQEMDGLARRALSGGYRVAGRADEAFHAARRMLGGEESGASPIHSTLDAPLQRYAAQVLRQHLGHQDGRNVSDGAVLVVDNASGQVLAYLGGSAELSSARYVDGVQALRQAGSTLKPFLYGLAFERRLLTPASLLRDEPMEVAVGGSVYRPQNYDQSFRGWVTARVALASSLNVPAVQVWQTVGGEPFVERLRRLGIGPLLEADFYGPSLALGSAEVRLWDMVNAYRTLANGGLWTPLTLRLSGRDAAEDAPRRVYTPEAAFLLGRILSDRQSRAATFGLESALATRFWTAVKTGTSKDMRDNWCLGYSSRYTVGVWVGNFSGEPMWDVSGVTGAAPVWLDLMNRLHESLPSQPPDAPPGVVEARVRMALQGEVSKEWFLRGSQPREVRPRPAAAAAARILSPAADTVFALDPEIPDKRQRLFFRLDDCPHCRWRLNGEDLGPASAKISWKPVPGRHLLQLIGCPPSQASCNGPVLDAVTFQVRGSLD